MTRYSTTGRDPDSSGALPSARAASLRPQPASRSSRSGIANARLRKLAERVEAAEGPSDELDALIEVELQRPNYPDAAVTKLGRVPAAAALKGEGRGWRSYGFFFQQHRYTRSLDAAIRLVPADHGVDLTLWGALWGGSHRARVLPIYQEGARWLHRGSDPHFTANAAWPALALCAAALKARAAQAIEARRAETPQWEGPAYEYGVTWGGSVEDESAVGQQADAPKVSP